jgi:hypothetical protein
MDRRRHLLVSLLAAAALAGCATSEGSEPSSGSTLDHPDAGAGGGAGDDLCAGRFLCGSGECVPRSDRCNGVAVCSDGSDEVDCGGGGGGGEGGGGGGGGETEPPGPSEVDPDAGPIDPCGGVTFAGHCVGNTVEWCEGGTIYTDNCDPDRVCGFNADAGWYACLAGPPPGDDGGGGGGGDGGGDEPKECGDVTAEGRCNGNTVEWCESGVLKSEACPPPSSCGFNADANLFACL